MIDTILEVMALIVESFSAIAINTFYGLLFILILTAAPLWILPYLIWRACERDDDSDDDLHTIINR